MGVDIWTGEIILRLKEQPEYKDIELVVVLSFPNHEKDWDKRSKMRLSFLINHSKECKIIRQKKNRRSYIEKDIYMVDQAEYLLAVYDNNSDERLQITKMVRYALGKRKGVIMIHPDTAQIVKLK